jgi:signal transduction histidine kinase
MSTRPLHPALSHMVTMGDRLALHPRRLQLLLDGIFVVIALATFAQLWDPDVLFHGIWVVLTLQAFLFGLRVSVLRIALAMFLLVLYFELGASTGPGHPGFAELDLAEWPLMIVIAVLVAVMADRVATTSRRYAELYRDASERLLTAQEDERKRLGRDLHDGVGQTLTAIVLTMDAAESCLWAGERTPSAMARSAILRAQELAAIALDETRDVAYRLRPARFVENGLVAAVKRLAETAGVSVTVVADADLTRPGVLDPDDEMSVYRVVQEALSNAIRHAHAQRIRVELTSDGRILTVRVTDDGVGFDSSTKDDRGLGLAGMRERALILRADLAIESTPGKGSRVVMRVPLPAADAPASPTPAAQGLAQSEASR